MADKYLGAQTYENACPDSSRLAANLTLKAYNSTAKHADQDFCPELYGINIQQQPSTLILDWQI
jgi:hypothetical protein